jgi:tRNA nucleotidyltransferase (CCA-adding enzyme)
MEPKDLDLEVFHLPREELERLFAGRWDFIGKSYGIYHFRDAPIDLGLPRREMPIGPLHGDFSVSVDPQMSMGEAAARRDFTINAIYYDPLDGALEDPFQGREDLSHRRLRHVSPRFCEDPLRVLRGAQFLARFRLRAQGETLRLCRTLSPDNLSAERIFAEIQKLILLGQAIGDGLEFLHGCGWTRFFPELAALGSCPQNAAFHPEGNVWAHTRWAMDAFSRLRPEPVDDALALGFAVLCHDFGKPHCVRWNSTGHLQCKGHGRAGVPPARAFLERMRAPERLLAQVLPLVEQHMVPRTFSNPAMASAGALRRLARVVGRIDLLLLLSRCDNLGRPPIVPDFSGEKRLEELARRENLLHGPPLPLLRGRDLIQRFHIEPSAEMGTLLARLFDAQLDGRFSSREEGLCVAGEMLHAATLPH